MEDIFGFSKEKKKRTLTTAKKRDILYEAGNRCQLCKKKFPPSVLHVHHIKEVSKHKEKTHPLDVSADVWGTSKKKPTYDRKSNLIVVCPNCHTKYHRGLVKKKDVKKAKGGKKKTKKVKRKNNSPFDIKIPRFGF